MGLDCHWDWQNCCWSVPEVEIQRRIATFGIVRLEMQRPISTFPPSRKAALERVRRLEYERDFNADAGE